MMTIMDSVPLINGVRELIRRQQTRQPRRLWKCQVPPICPRLPFHPRMFPCYCHLPPNPPLFPADTNTHQGAHTHTHTLEADCSSPQLISRTILPALTSKVHWPWHTWLGLPQRPFLGSGRGGRGVKGSRVLKFSRVSLVPLGAL